MDAPHEAANSEAMNITFLGSLDSRYNDFGRVIENASKEGHGIYPSSIENALELVQNLAIPKKTTPRDRGG